MTFSATLHNAQQGHAVIAEIWPKVKATLTAGQRLELTIRKEKRTPAQNRRYWGKGVLAQIAEQAAPGGKRFSADAWHEQFQRQFIGVIELPNGDVVGMSSADLDKEEFSVFCGEVEAYAVSDLGVVFQDLPNE